MVSVAAAFIPRMPRNENRYPTLRYIFRVNAKCKNIAGTVLFYEA